MKRLSALILLGIAATIEEIAVRLVPEYGPGYDRHVQTQREVARAGLQ